MFTAFGLSISFLGFGQDIIVGVEPGQEGCKHAVVDDAR